MSNKHATFLQLNPKIAVKTFMFFVFLKSQISKQAAEVMLTGT